ncbi:bifunctional phosphopantothenoylcysteine decarboxylase/phosphopantothenate--cysteine ligase CoaBC [Secundilactobacillus kimchicus]|uniref:bifunctional phosphopantothenoylcysteine decarboxylase/phosphopantothenate--cysteine ligase CoaBC n=1 Tax=Secundilactobacillus kimchicus TaxID=528209 RepID=UPI0024A97500|nr:bifunctional phosphopantothenoylcysteine decarboxylase/phosphopantothenate--cysteine ligase CoaBC [Secundilactobacillus kimchicus]
MLNGKHVTLYVTGSIAGYKALTLTRLLVKAGAVVRVVMTRAAQAFVTPLSFQVLSKNKVMTDPFEGADPAVVDHVELADWTDLAIIAPATAQLIGQLANGLADDMASLTLMATTAPILLAPAMNEHMLMSPAVQRNIRTLRTDGVHFVDPERGFLAEGYSGQGRMAEPETIVTAVSQVIDGGDQPLAGKKVVVTAGGTREAIDPVRFIGNRSSGKMGYAVAASLQQLGAEVTLISGPTRLEVPNHVSVISVATTEELRDQVVQTFKSADGLVMAAAVADFKPAKVADHKIKKTTDNDHMVLELVKTADILKAVATVKQANQVTVGFAAETNDLLENANKKLQSKQLDLLIANDVSQPGVGFNGDTNQVTFLQPNQPPVKTPLMAKTAIADLIGEKVVELLTKKEG